MNKVIFLWSFLLGGIILSTPAMENSHEIANLSCTQKPKEIEPFRIELTDGEDVCIAYLKYTLSDDCKSALLLELFVHPDYRRKGIGYTLFKTLIKQLFLKKVSILQWEVLPLPEEPTITVAHLVKFYTKVVNQLGLKDTFIKTPYYRTYKMEIKLPIITDGEKYD